MIFRAAHVSKITIMTRFIFAFLALMLSFVSAHAVSSRYIALSQSYMAQAQTALENQKLEEARALLERALASNPANAQAYTLIGRIHILQDDTAEGVRLIEIGLTIEPDQKQAYIWQGKAYLALDKIEDAQKVLEKLTTLCGDCAQIDTLAQAIMAVSEK